MKGAHSLPRNLTDTLVYIGILLCIAEKRNIVKYRNNLLQYT